ncbi:MAG: ATP phosphoribosyltransferase [Proteobacteria bacterium]|jgi:ATP phosphoribosyltransferase|nr:ATP phosphoribosyltransferase [Alphaproteobacteria bacterium]NCC03891.1 ATP phosphoribosyltransferase [Pseudomonadota bacterium]
MLEESRIRIAIQKSGRLAEESLKLLQNCGLHIDRTRDQLLCRVKELPIDLLLVRDDDIPDFVNNGICDLGIVGENIFAEKGIATSGFKATIATRLGFSKCRLSIAVPKEGPIQNLSGLTGKTLATTYPLLTGRFMEEKGIKVTIVEMSGSVEVAPRMKIADAICDIVASGATLTANSLTEITTVLNSEALLIRAPGAWSIDKENILRRLLARMRGVIKAEDSKYIMLHVDKKHLDKVITLIPGCESPTVLPLQRIDHKVAVHAVCRESVFWETMEQLEQAGASSILVLPIEKMMG